MSLLYNCGQKVAIHFYNDNNLQFYLCSGKMVVIVLLLFDAQKTTIQLDAILGLKWVVLLSFGDVLSNGNSIVFLLVVCQNSYWGDK